MKADIWMPLYIGDYLKKTMGLNRADHGSYLLLMMAYWSNGGPLPDDPEYLAQVAMVQQCEWQCLSIRLAKFFQVGDGVWRHNRIEEELARAKDTKERRSYAGKLGVEAKRKQCSSNGSSNGSANTPAKVKPSPSPSQLVQIPVSLDTMEFRNAWDVWRQHRKSKRKKLSVDLEQRQLNSLEPFGAVWAIERIQRAVDSNWTGLVFKDDIAASGKPVIRSAKDPSSEAWL